MSPEQANGRINMLGPPSDIYSLGTVLYHALTGRPPLLANSPWNWRSRFSKQDLLPTIARTKD